MKGCWLWMGHSNWNGYGLTHYYIDGKRKTVSVHRLSYAKHVGPIPSGLGVLHHCDVRSCYRPSHLFLGTTTDNMADMIAKGRKVKMLGADNPRAKLTPGQVSAIKQDSRKHHQIAADYGVSRSCVSMIKAQFNWSHV